MIFISYILFLHPFIQYLWSFDEINAQQAAEKKKKKKKQCKPTSLVIAFNSRHHDMTPIEL